MSKYHLCICKPTFKCFGVYSLTSILQSYEKKKMYIIVLSLEIVSVGQFESQIYKISNYLSNYSIDV